VIIMKKLYIILVFAAGCVTGFGQVTLTLRENAPVPGDTSRVREISSVEPGLTGENAVWDFSSVRFTGNTAFRGVRVDTVPGYEERVLILTEEGFDNISVMQDGVLLEKGYRHTTRRMVMDYSDPIVKMQYPFAYGQRYSDAFAGVATYNGASRTEVDGSYTISADGSGTLILPDRILRNVLRVRTVKSSLQQGVCGSTRSQVERYYWSAPGYRYPVMMTGSVESRRGAGDPVITRTAWINLEQPGRSGSVQGTGALAGEDDPGVFVFPNPFSETLNYSYFLRRSLPVKVELSDVSGRYTRVIEPFRPEPEGLHKGTVSATELGLPPGVYYLRFTFDRQVFVSKVVKI